MLPRSSFLTFSLKIQDLAAMGHMPRRQVSLNVLTLLLAVTAASRGPLARVGAW